MKMLDIDKLREGYKSWYGEPNRVFHFFIEPENSHQFQLDIFVYYPIEEEDLPTTAICTLGLSLLCLAQDNKNPLSELVLELSGKQAESDCKKIAESLVNLVEKGLLKSSCITAEEIYPHQVIPSNPDLNQFMVIDWGVGTTDYLPGIEPYVKLLRVVPLFSEEANQLMEIPIGARTQIVATTLSKKWDDAERERVQFSTGAINRLWHKIERWYEENAPLIFSELGAGASLADIAMFQQKTGLVLPEDFVASYMVHNGNVQFHDYRYLSLAQVEDNWNMLNKMLNDGKFIGTTHDPEKRIQDVWWHSAWIPFAEDSGGNLICIDLDPAANGVRGQVFYWEISDGPCGTHYTSFFAWLKAYKDLLYQGGLIVSADGFIIPKTAI